MVQLKNHQTYYSKTVTLLIIIVEKGENINWERMFFQGLKPHKIYGICMSHYQEDWV
jgi:hypothetical protein